MTEPDCNETTPQRRGGGNGCAGVGDSIKGLANAERFGGHVRWGMASQRTGHDPTDDHVESVLNGEMSYDDLTSEEAQALVREVWKQRSEQLRTSLDLKAEFELEGRSWVELDGNGNERS